MSRHAIDHRERQRLEAMLATLPLPEVRARSGRSFMTLIRIVQAQEKAA